MNGHLTIYKARRYRITNGLQITKDYKGLQIKMIITITIVLDQYRNIKDKNKK